MNVRSCVWWVMLVAGAACGVPTEDEPQDLPRSPKDGGTSRDAGSGFPDYALDGGYATFSLEGWTIHLAQPLVEAQRAVGKQVVTRLGSDLRTVVNAVPATSLPLLRGVHFWVEVAQPEFPGGAYHPSAQWLTDHGYPAAWARGVMLGNAANYLDWTRIQPAMVLHELAHAWHDQKLGFNDAEVMATYAAALDGGVYDAVAYAGGGTMRAYGLNNDREYFAETSEAWFWRNDFAPFVRADLQREDPRGAALVQAKWSLP